MALVFPPQWDPRQPPLGVAVIAGFLLQLGVEVRIFDLNLALYRYLLAETSVHSLEDHLFKRVLDPAIYADPHRFAHLSDQVERILGERFDASGEFSLAWDSVKCILSENSSSAWKKVLDSPEAVPHPQWFELQATEILVWQPEVICLSLISDSQLLIGLSFFSRLRQQAPDLTFILGGDAVFYRRSLLHRFPDSFTPRTFIVGGEAEPFFADFFSPSRPDICTNELGPKDSVHDMSEHFKRWDFASPSLPAWHLLPLDQYLSPALVLPVETARGCPWGRCAFCIHPGRSPQGEPGYRLKPLLLLREELLHAMDMRVRRFFFVDEALTQRRFQEVCQIIEGLKTPLTWIAYARLDRPQDPGLWKRLFASGCRKLFFGLETGSDRLLGLFLKGTRAEIMVDVIRGVSQAGIAIHLFLMTGFPGETEADRQQTIDLLRRTLPHVDPFGFSYDLFSLQAELETPLFQHPELFGCSIKDGGPDRDLSYQFSLANAPPRSALVQFADQIHSIVEESLKHFPGLRRLKLSQDSLHLLFLEHCQKP